MQTIRSGGLSRRRFLAGSSAAVASAGIAPIFFPAVVLGKNRDDRATGASDDAWEKLKKELSGRLLRPWQSGFRGYAKPNNLRYASMYMMPAGIARCNNTEDVKKAIQWCRDHRVPLIARSGGHSYAGFSTTDGLMIDLGPMNAARLDDSSGRLQIGGGARNGDIFKALQEKPWTITHGRCPTVGAAGFLLGGGIGFNMREGGLGCDLLEETEIVMAAGTVRTVGRKSTGEDADLFWACCGGGGGNFGINTSFTLRTFPTAPVTVFKRTWTKEPQKAFAALMPALNKAPPTLGSRISIRVERGRPLTVDLLGQFKGTINELEGILSSVPSPDTKEGPDHKNLPYWKGQQKLEDPGEPAYFQERSTFLHTGTLSSDQIETVFRELRKWPGTSAKADLRFFQLGGKINTRPDDETAYVHRDPNRYQWLMVVGLNWEPQDWGLLEKNHAWQDAFYAAVLQFKASDGRSITSGAYQNFTDPSLKDWGEAYYGDNFGKLKRIKACVDPHNVFRFDQSIPPSKCA